MFFCLLVQAGHRVVDGPGIGVLGCDGVRRCLGRINPRFYCGIPVRPFTSPLFTGFLRAVSVAIGVTGGIIGRHDQKVGH